MVVFKKGNKVTDKLDKLNNLLSLKQELPKDQETETVKMKNSHVEQHEPEGPCSSGEGIPNDQETETLKTKSSQAKQHSSERKAMQEGN